MENSNNENFDFIDKLASFVSKNNIQKYNNLQIKIVEKNDKIVNYTIIIEEDNNKIKKLYTKRLIPYKRRKEFNEKSLYNLRYKNKNNGLIIKNSDTESNKLHNSINSFEKKVSKINFNYENEKSNVNTNSNISEYNKDILKDNYIKSNDIINIINNIDIDEKNIDFCDKCHLYKDFIKGINEDYLEKFNNICNLNYFFNNNIEGIIDIEQEQYNIFYNKIYEISKIHDKKDIIECIDIYNNFRKDYHDKIKVLCKESGVSILSDYYYIEKYSNDVLNEIY